LAYGHHSAKESLERLPTVIASSIIRSSYKGESHGGAYLVDLETGEFDQILDYSDSSISWEGRGGNRGFRGIAFHEGEVYLAASNEIFVYSQNFDFMRSIQSKYLKHCHEIYIAGDTLYMTSTGFDSVLEYDLRTRSFVTGYSLKFGTLGRGRKKMGFAPLPRLRSFDPYGAEGPEESNTCHLNNVFRDDGTVFVSGTRCAHLLAINGTKLSSHARIPYGTHNARPFGEGVLMNHTDHDRISYFEGGREKISLPIQRYDERELLNTHLPQKNARQAFGRGLCILGEGLIASGSSPATISIYDLNASSVLKTINLTMDVRKTIHGLEVWPF
jgi:hypothetical protein